MTAVRLGFLGLGWIGAKRLDAVAALGGVDVVAVCDSNEARLQHTHDRHPGAVATRELDELLGHELDGVVIATPSGCHAEQALACFERGVAVFCQKPLATTAADAERVIYAARHADRLLGVDFCYRHVDGMSELHRRLQGGELGRIAAIDMTFHNAYGPDKGWCFDPHLAGGGCVLDLGVHLLDLAQWLSPGREARLVHRRLFAKGEPIEVASGMPAPIEDLAFAQFERPDGTVWRLACSWHAPIGRGAVIELRVLGAAGGARWHNVGGSFYDFELELHRGSSAERIGRHPDEWGERALRAWLDRLAGNRGFDSQCAEFLHSARAVDAVYGR